MFFIGIDVAKRSHQAAVTDISGNVIVKPFNFKNSSDGFTKFLSAVESNAIEKKRLHHRSGIYRTLLVSIVFFPYRKRFWR